MRGNQEMLQFLISRGAFPVSFIVGARLDGETLLTIEHACPPGQFVTQISVQYEKQQVGISGIQCSNGEAWYGENSGVQLGVAANGIKRVMVATNDMGQISYFAYGDHSIGVSAVSTVSVPEFGDDFDCFSHPGSILDMSNRLFEIKSPTNSDCPIDRITTWVGVQSLQLQFRFAC